MLTATESPNRLITMSQAEQTDKHSKSRSEVSGLVKALRFTFVEEQVSAIAHLLYDEAPLTCDVVVAGLPYHGDAVHGEYSGPEVFTVLPGRIHAPKENDTVNVADRDVGFLRFKGGTDVVATDKVASEIAWFYGDDAVPSMKDGPIALNIFARFAPEGWQQFVAVCRSIQPGHSRPLRIEAANTAEDWPPDV